MAKRIRLVPGCIHLIVTGVSDKFPYGRRRLIMFIDEMVEERTGLHPAGDLEAELAQLGEVESLLANIYASSCSTNSTSVCSGGVCCF